MKFLVDNNASTGSLVLRIGLGVMWISHALLKLFVFTIPGLGGWLESQGFPAFLAWPLFITELAAGILILIGYYGRYISVAMTPILLIAAWTHLPNGWVHTNQGGGYEYPLFLVIVSIAHFIFGDGRIAIHTEQHEAT